MALPSRKPPWIVVDHVIEKIIVADWPGKLWAVEILDADPEAQKQLIPDVWYTRAVVVDVIEELPVARLFGIHGEQVFRIIEAARRLDLDQVERLAAAYSPGADEAYSAAWNAWLGIGGRSGSPINCGFSVIHREVWNRARLLVGDAAFVTDQEGEKSLGPPWSNAGGALIHAAMAAGRPDLVTAEGRRTLAEAWVRVFGPI